MYTFSTPLPIIAAHDRGLTAAESSSLRLEVLTRDSNNDGILFPKQDLTDDYRTPVPGSHFKKCSGVSAITLAPGGMKKC